MMYRFNGGCVHSQSGAHGAYTVTRIIEKRNLLKRKQHIILQCFQTPNHTRAWGLKLWADITMGFGGPQKEV